MTPTLKNVVVLAIAVIAFGLTRAESASPHVSIMDLGTLPGDDESAAGNINERGQVVGYSDNGLGAFHAFLFENGTMIDLGTLPNGVYSMALAINERGQVVGWSDNGSFLDQSVLWTR